MFDQFNPNEKPVLWLRFVSFGYICNQLIMSEGRHLAFEDGLIPTRELLQNSADQDVSSLIGEYERAIQDIWNTKL